MKKLLVFLLLFAGGLFVLRLFQGPGPGLASGAGDSERPAWARGDGTEAPGMTPGGAIAWRRFLETPLGTRPVEFRLRATDSGRTPDGEFFTATDAVLEFLDQETGALRMNLDAGGMRVRELGQVNYVPRVADQLELTDVVLTVLEGAPIVPITLRVPTLHVDLATRTLRSNDAATIEGERLTGEGTGFFADETKGILAFDRDAELRFVREDDRESALFSKGLLRLEREPGEGAKALKVLASGGAKLEPGVEDSLLEADVIRIQARETGGPEEPFLLQGVDAEVGVHYRLGQNEFEGERARVDFDLAGRPERARISGRPIARIQLADAGGKLPGAEALAPGSRLVLRGEGVMDVAWGDELTFRVGGPAVAEGDGATLRCLGDIVATASADGSRASMDAEGGVRLERENGVLVAERVHAEIGDDEEGRSRLFVRAEGTPLLTGTSADGRDFVLNSTDALAFEQLDEHWTIPEAGGIELTVFGEESFRARADRVADFDPETLSLRASGTIEFESAAGNGQGEELVVRDPEHFVLTGTPERRARFAGPEGEASALRVERDGDQLVLSEQVSATITPAPDRVTPAGVGETYDLACDRLTLVRGEETDDEGRAVRVFTLDAVGAVEATVRGPQDRVTLSGERLAGARRETLDADGAIATAWSALTAREVKNATLEREPDVRVRIECDVLTAERTEEGPEATIVSGEVKAQGGVVFQGTSGEVPFSGVAEALSLDHVGNTAMRAAPGERVVLSGVLPSNGRPFEMEASWILSSEERLEADEPDIRVKSMGEGADAGRVDVRVRAGHMLSTRTWLEFMDAVRVEGVLGTEQPWELDADTVRFEGTAARPEEGGEVSALMAFGNVEVRVPNREARATGDELTARTLSGTMRLEGRPAHVEAPFGVIDAEWIEINVDLGMVMGTGKGTILPPPMHADCQDEAHADEWSIRYLSSRTLVGPDELIFVLQEPEIEYAGAELYLFLPLLPKDDLTLTASWAVMWLDRREWSKLPDRIEAGEFDEIADEEAEAAEDTMRGAQAFWARIRRYKVLNEVYLEGPVEVNFEDGPGARADAVYLDIVSGHGWLSNASFTIEGSVLGREFKKVKVKAKWLRQSDDLSFHADEATIAPCEFDDPHLKITTGDFRVEPREDGHFNFKLKENRIQAYDKLKVPLPSLNWTADEELKPEWASIEFGDSARFGSFISAGVVRPADRVGEVFHSLIGGADLASVDAEYSIDASYLGSRGVLLDLGLSVEAQDEYWMSVQLGGIPDVDDDRGYVRVDEDDRDTLRLWGRTRGRYFLEEDEWIDIAGSVQTDAGVQSEFFEREFQRYEQSENYVHWRKARDEYYFAASAKAQFNDFFTDVEELPSLSAYRGRAPLLSLGPTSLIYSADATAEYLQRHESEDGFASPYGFPAVFPDGLGDRDVMRFDTTHRLEAPLPRGPYGLRATPFVLGRFTAWDDDVTEDDQPLRGLGQAGLRISTAFWKEAGEGAHHQLVPYVEARGDFLLEEEGGVPVTFDEVELPVEGNFVDVGVRGRIDTSGGKSLLDFDLRSTYADDVAAGEFDGWREIGVFSRLSIEPFDVPTQIFHDGRYDVEEHDTLYSNTSVGVRFTERLAMQAAHLRGLDLDRDTLFEAASGEALYTWTEKWELAGRQTISLRDGDSLGSRLTVRRYGHDIIFEIESSFRRGEGTSFGIGIRPAFNWKRPTIGFLDF